jgi:hypothetical protein
VFIDALELRSQRVMRSPDPQGDHPQVRPHFHTMARTRPDEDTDIWVERCTRYSALVDMALDPLRESFSGAIFCMLYEEQSMLWIEEQLANPHIVSQPDDQLAQGVFFQNIDAICATFDTVNKTDWKAYVFLSFKVSWR